MVKLGAILTCIIVFKVGCKCYNYEDTKRLLEYLFDASRYNKFIRPVKESSTITQVNISQNIRAISNFDVVTGFMCSYSFITMSWRDELLTWNSSDYGGITEMALQIESIWNPQLEKTFAGACKDTDVEDKTPILNTTLSYDGIVLIHQAKSIGVICLIDMKMFPFDEHTCVHQFYTTRYTPDELVIQFNQENVVDKTFYKENQEWSVEKSDFNVRELNDAQSSLYISYAESMITVKRRPSFIMVNNFAPYWLVSILIILAPLVPPDCERLSFSITTYLAMIFMNVSFVSEMPRNSTDITLVSQNMLAFSVISTVGIIWSIWIVSLSNISTSERKVPHLFKKCLGKNIKTINSEDIPVDSSDENKNSAQSKIITDMEKRNPTEVGWYEVARFLDKVFFAISVLFVGLINVGIYLNINTK